MEQDYKNHVRLVPLWHYFTASAILLGLIGSFINVINSAKENVYSASLLLLVFLILVFLWTYARLFALKAQDRAIRAEENFRHFVLTGKPLDPRLRLSQIIALRFASDAEMVALAKRAAEEKLPAKQIKQAIQQWRGDYYRV